MKKNKAFTLIELLAVIIILAAIALIIAPLVLDIIREQQKKTFKESINGILRSSRLEIVNSGLSFPATFTYSDGKLLSPTGKELKVTGKIPDGNGSVRYNSEDDIDLAIHDNTWCGTYNKTSKEVDVGKYDGDCKIELANVTPAKCFQVKDRIKHVEYTVNQTECITYFTQSGMFDEDAATSLCNGGVFDGVTLDEVFKLGYLDYDELEQTGAITITSRTVDGVMITKYNKSDSDCPVDVVIPETIGGVTVKAIGQAAFVENWDGNWDNEPATGDSKHINSVTFPSSLETIGWLAFAGALFDEFIFNEITNLDFSKATSLQTIGDNAFQNNRLTSVTIPNSVTRIEAGAFEKNQLTTVVIPNGVTIIGPLTFSENQLTSVTIPSSVTSIGFGAFDSNKLPSVDLSGLTSLQTIENSAFYNNQLTSVVIPDSVTSIGASAFQNNRLTSVTIPNSVTSIGPGAFNSNQLTNVVIPESVTSIDSSAFSVNRLTSVTIQGKNSSSDFTCYGNNIWGWASGYNDSNIIWNG